MPLIAGTAGILVEWAVVFTVARLFAWPSMLLAAFASIALAVASLFMWKQEKKYWVSTPKQCVKALGIVPVVGALLFCLDMIIGEIFHPMTNPITAALNMGMFGGALTAIATPSYEIMVLGSLVRSMVRQVASSR
jgi:hypothetical protein